MAVLACHDVMLIRLHRTAVSNASSANSHANSTCWSCQCLLATRLESYNLYADPRGSRLAQLVQCFHLCAEHAGERLVPITSQQPLHGRMQGRTEASAFDRQLARDTGAERPAASTTCHNALRIRSPLSDPLLGIQLWAVPLQCTSPRFISASLRLLNSACTVVGCTLSTGMAQSWGSSYRSHSRQRPTGRGIYIAWLRPTSQRRTHARQRRSDSTAASSVRHEIHTALS